MFSLIVWRIDLTHQNTATTTSEHCLVMFVRKCSRFLQFTPFRNYTTHRTLHVCCNASWRSTLSPYYSTSSLSISTVHSLPLPAHQLKHVSEGAGLLNPSAMRTPAHAMQQVKHKSKGKSKKSRTESVEEDEVKWLSNDNFVTLRSSIILLLKDNHAH